ncbi:MAG: hypothetical protein HON94_13620 [Methylococcales bacterium]|jgi:hypothetical protein|nr:hypothetical protein [Methylococcales bacterium]MBT7411154.1 hypothetical protein [Methylococcales bacterium]
MFRISNIVRIPFIGIKRIFQADGKLQFWLSQITVVISTIIGVYLAANTGFEKAMQFENITKQRDVYYLATALQMEMEDNIKTAKEFTALLSKGGYYTKSQRLKFATFVWQAMGESSETFQIRPDVLTQNRRYFQDIDSILDKLDNKRLGRNNVINKMDEITKIFKEKTIPILQQQRDKIKSFLIKNKLNPDIS